MIIKLNIFLIINCFLLYCVLSEKTAKTCNTQELNNICPINTKCKQKESDIGDCQCDDNYYFNKLYQNDSDYCIFSNKTVTSTAAPIVLVQNVTAAPIITSTSTTAAPLITKVITTSVATTTTIAPKIESTSTTTTKPITIPSNPSTLSVELYNKTPDNTPGGHHVVSGILIPVLIVLIIIGSVFTVQKYNLLSKIRNYVIARRHRPFYEDVMMGNDLDDPLLT